MKTFIALFVATLAVTVQAGYVPSAWPVSTYGVDSWNGLNSWNYPYGVNQWASAWPATYSNNGWYGQGGKTVVQANVAKLNPWGGLPRVPSYGYGYNNYPGSIHVVPLVGHAINQKLIVA